MLSPRLCLHAQVRRELPPKAPFLSPCESVLLIGWDHVLCFICWSVRPRWAIRSSKCLNFACVIVSTTVHYASVKYYAFGCKIISADSLFLLMLKGICRFNRTVVLSKCLKCFCMTFYYSGEKKKVNATSTVDTCKIDNYFLKTYLISSASFSHAVNILLCIHVDACLL